MLYIYLLPPCHMSAAAAAAAAIASLPPDACVIWYIYHENTDHVTTAQARIG